MADFIESFLKSAIGGKGPGLIRLQHSETQLNMTGILASEVTVSAQTTYGSLIPDISTLADLAGIAGFASLPTWIGASTLMWKGTAPITFGADMYLVNYKPDLGHEENLKKLTKLCTLSGTEFGDARDSFTVKVHGGYSSDAFANNSQFFRSTSEAYQKFADNPEDAESAKNFYSMFSGDGTQFSGTLTVSIGSNFRLGYLLLTKIDVAPSLVEVSDNGRDPKPLYYRVGMSFTTCRAGLEGDVNNMF